MTLFKVLWGMDAFASLVLLYFFFIGLGDRSVSSRNIGLWMIILILLAVILFGSILLRHQYPGLSLGLLCIPAIPVLLYLLFMLVTIFGKGRWN